MLTVAIQLMGLLIFAGGTVVLGVWLRKVPTQRTAVRAGRISHLLFYLCLVLPGAVGLFEPGLRGYDSTLGIRPLPYRSLSLALGAPLLVAGTYLLVASNAALAKLGAGAAAFRLTQRFVDGGVYRLVRNPMSLGYYLVCLSLGLMAGSTAVSLGVIIFLLPAHAFNLKYFEELELEIRYGAGFSRYKETVPFLIPRFFPFPGSGRS